MKTEEEFKLAFKGMKADIRSIKDNVKMDTEGKINEIQDVIDKFYSENEDNIDKMMEGRKNVL